MSRALPNCGNKNGSRTMLCLEQRRNSNCRREIYVAACNWYSAWLFFLGNSNDTVDNGEGKPETTVSGCHTCFQFYLRVCEWASGRICDSELLLVLVSWQVAFRCCRNAFLKTTCQSSPTPLLKPSSKVYGVPPSHLHCTYLLRTCKLFVQKRYLCLLTSALLLLMLTVAANVSCY